MIPLALTSITVKRAPLATVSETDPWERTGGPSAPVWAVVEKGVPATITRERGSSSGPGDTQTIEFLLSCDSDDLKFRDIVVDEQTDVSYGVVWALPVPDTIGLGHTKAGLTTVTGFGNA